MRPISHTTHDRSLPFLGNKPLSEFDILRFHASFMSVGLHTIQTSDMHSARSTISALLTSLDYYCVIGWVTQEQGELPGFFNLYNDIIAQGYDDNLEDYLLDATQYDCLWIEESSSWPWLIRFKQILQSLSFDVKIPIILVSKIE